MTHSTAAALEKTPAGPALQGRVRRVCDPIRPGGLSAGEFGAIARQLEGFRHLVAVVSLDLDDSILDRAACATHVPQVFAQGLEGVRRQV